MQSIHAVKIDGIERPCKNCDTVNTHWAEPSRGDCQKYEPAVIESTTPAFDAILEVARAAGRPKMYTSDLFRDYQILTGRTVSYESTPPRSFLWTVYDCGTHMVRLDAAEPPRNGEGALDLLRCIEHNFGPQLWYHWTGHRLVAVTPEKARELARDADVMAHWLDDCISHRPRLAA